MENYRNSSFFAQEGGPSFDFMLLDGLPTSTVSGPGATASIFPGENPVSSFDFVDGAGIESFNDHSFPAHRSFTAQTPKDALRGPVSMQSGTLQRQEHSENYLSGQNNQQFYFSLGKGDGHVESHIRSMEGRYPELLGAGNMPMPNALSGKAQSIQIGTGSKGNVYSIHNHVHGRGNQASSTQHYPTNSPNTSSSKFSNFLPVSLGVSEHELNANDVAGASYLNDQNQIHGGYDFENIAGNAGNEKLSRSFPPNQLPNGYAASMLPEARVEAPLRGFEVTEMQLSRRQDLHSKQAQDMQLKQHQIMMLQQLHPAIRQHQKVQQEAVVMAQKQEILRLQRQQEEMRLQRQEAIQSQQQDAFRMQQQELYLKQQGTLRTEEMNSGLWSQGQVEMLSRQQDMVSQQQTLWSQQPNSIWHQQEAGQSKSLQAQQEWAWLGHHHQQQQPYHRKVSSLNQHQALQFQQMQSLQQQQTCTLPNQQQHPMHSQQQALQTSRQQAPQSQQKHFSSGQHLVLPSSQEMRQASQQALSQETCTNFQGTSYSALLHGPDTPPSQIQSVGDAPFAELAGNTAALPPANSHTVVWPTYGSSSLQQLPREPSGGQQPAVFYNLQLPSRVDHNFEVADGNRRQNSQTEYPVFGSRAEHAFEFNKSESGDSEARCFLSVSKSVSDPKNTEEFTKPVQTSNILGGQSCQFNGLSNGSIQANVFSQSQQHFQVLQLSQQRSWERLVQKHGVSKPILPEACPPLSQSIPTVDRSTAIDSRLQQNFGSPEAISMSRSHDLQQIAGLNPDTTAGSRLQQQITNTAVGPVSTSILDEEDIQCYDSLSLMKPLSSQDVGYRPHCDSISSNITGQTRALKQVIPMLGRVDSAGPSGGMSHAIPTMNHGSILNMQMPSEKMKVRKDLFGEENATLKENQAPGQTLYLKNPDFSKDFWKQGASVPDSVNGSESTCKSRNGHIDDHRRKHFSLNDKESSDFCVNMRDSASQPVLEKWLMGDQDVLQQVHNSVRLDSPPTANAVTVLSEGVNGESKVTHCCRLDASIWPQGSTIGKLKISDLSMNPSCSESVSLAHLRQSQPSSPHSPQQVKLGLGPTNLCQIIKQGSSASTPTSPQKDRLLLNNYGLSNTDSKNYFARTSQGSSGCDSPAGSRNDPNQGNSASFKDMVLQNNARASSAFSNSLSVCRETAGSHALLLPTGITHGFGGVFSHRHNNLSGIDNYDVTINAGNVEEESSTTLHSKLKSPVVSSKQPLYNVSNSQGRFSYGLQKAKMDGKSLHVLQKQQISNMALKQLGSEGQSASFMGQPSTLRTSVAEHSEDSGVCEKSFPKLGESGWPSIKARNSALSMSNQNLVSRMAVEGHADDDFSLHGKASSLSVLSEYDQNQSFKQDEGIESSTLGLFSDLHAQNSQLLAVNRCKSDALQSVEQGASVSVMTATYPSSSQVELRSLNTQAECFGQEQYLQQQNLCPDSLSYYKASQVSTVDSLSYHQASQVSTVDSMHPTKMASAAGTVDELTGSQLEPLKGTCVDGCLGAMSLGQGNDTPVENMHNSSAVELETSWQETTSVSNLANQSGQRLADMSSLISAQEPHQIATNSVIASSLPCIEKVCNAELADCVQTACNMEWPGNAANGQVLHPQNRKQDNISASDRLESCSTNFFADESSQPVAQMDHLTGRQVNTENVKAEVAGAGTGQFVTFDRFAPCQGSSSKTSSLGPSAIHPKKRKKPLPLLIPWYIAATQPRDSLPSTSEMELMWANTANRLSDKDDGDYHKGSISTGIKAKRRLRLSTQLMQQLVPPPSMNLMHANTPLDIECATFGLTKAALEDACRLVTNTRREATASHDCSDNENLSFGGQRGRTWGKTKSVAVLRCVENFMKRARGLEDELARIETSTSVSDLGQDICDTEKLTIVNRLARHHGANFTADSGDLCSIHNISDYNSGIWRPSLKKYVTIAPMPRTLPGVKCSSL